jgi:mRNA-degrading endonuclease RelE of RelBE toxin-antitoxin system
MTPRKRPTGCSCRGVEGRSEQLALAPPLGERRQRLEAFVAGASPNADVKKLRATKPATWRLRLGNFRALYRTIAGVLIVVDVDNRKDVYRRAP